MLQCMLGAHKSGLFARITVKLVETTDGGDIVSLTRVLCRFSFNLFFTGCKMSYEQADCLS